MLFFGNPSYPMMTFLHTCDWYTFTRAHSQPHTTNLFLLLNPSFLCVITSIHLVSLFHAHTHNPRFFSLTIFAPSISPVTAPALPSISHLHGNSPATGWPLMANESVRCPGSSSNGGRPGAFKVNAQGGVSTYILVYLAASIAGYLFHLISVSFFLCFWIIWMQKCNAYFLFF